MVVFLALKAFVCCYCCCFEFRINHSLPSLSKVHGFYQSTFSVCNMFMELLPWLGKLPEQVGGVLLICISTVAILVPYIRDVQ